MPAQVPTTSAEQWLTVTGLPGWRGPWITLAGFWPHNDAQRSQSLNITEQHLTRSTGILTGSGCARRSLRIRCSRDTHG